MEIEKNDNFSNLPAVIPKQPDFPTERSEEVQSIIERMPTYWAKWVALCVGVLIGIIILLGFLIKYPDTIDGQVSVTAVTAPVRLVANTSGRLILLQPDKTHIQEGSVISYIESGADYRHILWVDSLLNNPASFENQYCILPDSLLLGDVSSAYNAFMLSRLQYERLLSSDIYTTMRQNLQNQVNSDKLVIENLNEELKLKTHILADSEHRLRQDSILLDKEVISEQDYQQQRTSHLSLKESRLNLESSRLLTIGNQPQYDGNTTDLVGRNGKQGKNLLRIHHAEECPGQCGEPLEGALPAIQPGGGGTGIPRLLARQQLRAVGAGTVHGDPRQEQHPGGSDDTLFRSRESGSGTNGERKDQ